MLLELQTQDRKSTTRGCQFLGNRLIPWQCKKQTIVATSTAEAEYVAVANCCGQVDKDWKEKFFYPANHVREVEPKKVRENNDAPIIEDWVSDDEDEVETTVVGRHEHEPKFDYDFNTGNVPVTTVVQS
ncbi:putative ribonuclease H-like domain-containing protein [Tanacetum coccineum]